MTNQEALNLMKLWRASIEINGANGEHLEAFDMAIDALSEPSQPEIIRCKDCKYMMEHYDTGGNVPYWTCSEWDAGTDYDGFCHYAERRTDE